MPPITIRTSPEIYIPAGTANLNPYYKEFVNQLLSIAPDLAVKTVHTDNSSNYNVTLSFMGNPDIGVQLQCGGQNLIVSPGYWNKDGKFNAFDSDTTAMFSVGRAFKVASYGVDGTLVYVMPYSGLSSTSNGFVLGMFTSTGLESPQFCAGSVNTSYIYPEMPDPSFCVSSPFYTIAPTKDGSETITYDSFSSRNFLKIGYTHALLPAFYYGQTGKNAFLNIKWGGKYNIYRLYDADGIVNTRPGDIVTINGVEMLSPGYVAVIE